MYTKLYGTYLSDIYYSEVNLSKISENKLEYM